VGREELEREVVERIVLPVRECVAPEHHAAGQEAVHLDTGGYTAGIQGGYSAGNRSLGVTG